MNQPGIDDIYPLTPTQEGLLFHCQAEPDSGLYWTQFSFEIIGALNAASFQVAWSEVLAKTPALRSVFVWEKVDRPLQVVRKNIEVPWTLLDWSLHSQDEQSRLFQQHLRADRALGCNLQKGPLVRFALITLGDCRYRFVWSSHHLILDGWSLFLVLNEALDTYDSIMRSEARSVQPPSSFKSYVNWLGTQSWAEAEGFFCRHLAGVRTPTPLAIDHPANAANVAVIDFPSERIVIPSSIVSRLISFARARRVTLNTVMQATWGLLLHRYSSESDVLFGVTFSGRSAPIDGVEAIAGLLINSLPVRYSVNSGKSVGKWIEEMHLLQAEHLQFQHAPLLRVQEWSEIPRGLPLFESLFIFDNYPVQSGWTERSSGLSLRDVQSVERTNYPLTVFVGVQTTAEVMIQYDARRFRADSIRRMLGHFQQLVESILAQPECRIRDLSLLTPAEQSEIVVDWNKTAVEYASDKCVHQIFESQVRDRPDQIAVTFEKQQLTYFELNERADALAAELRNAGVRSEILVGLFVERSIDMIVGVLGILKAGGAYVPLDPAFPSDRIAMMIEDAEMPVIVTQTRILTNLPTVTARKICFNPEGRVLVESASRTSELSVCSPNNLAYVLFTSGSTGRPKGVQITHRSLVNFLDSMKRIPGFVSDDVLLAITTLSFDIAGLELLLPLITGAKVVIAPRDVVADGTRLTQLIHDSGATVMQATPATWQMLVEGGWTGNSNLKILCGGDALSRDLASQLLKRCGELWNMYGPTETTIWSTCIQIQDSHLTISIGRPINNTEIYVVDTQMRPVPIGIAGELLIGGDGVARGYLSKPDLTAEKFVRHPLQSGERVYRTGDLGRYLVDGTIELLGRADQQVKLRGFRIELGEIEAILVQHTEVNNAVVVAHENKSNGEKRLVAYLITRSDATPSTDVLIRHLRQSLPDYMVPSAFIALKQFPLTPNGKIDRKALPKPDEAESLANGAFQPPRTALETKLADIWKTVLGVERIGIHDSFFRMGGHSLLALKAISRMRQQFDVEVPVSSLFEAPTVESMAIKLAELQAEQLDADELNLLFKGIE